MGFFSRLIGRKEQEPGRPVAQFKSSDSTLDNMLWGDLGFTAASVTGIYVSQQTALTSSAVMACVTMLAEDVGKLPWSIFRNAEGETRKEEKSHYLYDLLEQPNEWQNGFEFREQMQVSLILRGNAYAIIPRNGRGVPLALIPVNSDWMSLWPSPDGSLFYRVTTQDLHLMAILRRYGMPMLIPFDDVLHIRGFSMNGLMGLSRIFLAREAIALFIAQEQQAARWMGNAARPSGMLSTDQKLTPEGAKRVAADIRENWGGLQNSGKVIIGEQGLKFQPFSMTASDIEFIASREFQMKEIGRIFRIPPHMLGEISRMASNTISQMGQEYVNFTLTGYTDRWRAKFSSQFDLKRQGLSIEFDYNKITQADMTSRINNWRTAIMSMIAKPDEARLDLGLPAEGGDAAKLHYPVNLAVEGSQANGVAPDGAGRPPADVSPAKAETLNSHGKLNGQGGNGHAAMPDLSAFEAKLDVGAQLADAIRSMPPAVVNVTMPPPPVVNVKIENVIPKRGTVIKEIEHDEASGRAVKVIESEMDETNPSEQRKVNGGV